MVFSLTVDALVISDGRWMQQTRGSNQLRCWCIETAVMLFGPSRRRDAWKEHVDQILARGERRLAACLSWTPLHQNIRPYVLLNAFVCLTHLFPAAGVSGKALLSGGDVRSRVRTGSAARRQTAPPLRVGHVKDLAQVRRIRVFQVSRILAHQIQNEIPRGFHQTQGPHPVKPYFRISRSRIFSKRHVKVMGR